MQNIKLKIKKTMETSEVLKEYMGAGSFIIQKEDGLMVANTEVVYINEMFLNLSARKKNIEDITAKDLTTRGRDIYQKANIVIFRKDIRPFATKLLKSRW